MLLQKDHNKLSFYGKYQTKYKTKFHLSAFVTVVICIDKYLVSNSFYGFTVTVTVNITDYRDHRALHN